MSPTPPNGAEDALLVYPPFVATSVNGPHLALGLLSAHLRTCGMRASIWDGNIRFVRWLLDAGRLAPRLAELRASFHELDAEPELGIDEYFELRQAAKAFDVEAEIAQAIRGDDDASFGALARVLRSIHGQELSEILRSTDAVVEALKSDSPASIVAQFLGEQEAFFAKAATVGLVGINVSFSEQLHAAGLIAQELARRFGEARPAIILGGTQISLLASSQIQRLLELPFIDGVSVYEGERPLQSAVTATRAAIAGGRPPSTADLSEVPNLCTRARPTVIHFADPIAPNELPTPAFEPDDMRLYYAPMSLPVFVTKGCYWGKCTFCDYTKLATPSTVRWVERDVDRVVGDLRQLVAEHAVTTFHLISDAVPPRWYRRFADAIVHQKLRLHFFSYLKNEHPEVLTQDFFFKLSEAGVKLLICGVESPIDRILDVIEKGTQKSDIEANFRMMAAAGIRAVCNLIPDYPSTRFDEVQETIRFVRDNVDWIPSLSVQFFDLSVASAIAGSPEIYQITVEGRRPEGSSHGAHTLAFTHKTLSAEQLRWMRTVFPALASMVARYHETKEPIRAVSEPDFDWTRSSLMFQGFARMTSRYPPAIPWNELVVQGGSEVLWLRQRTLGTELALPAEMLPLVELMERRTFVTFPELLEAAKGLDATSLSELLLRLVRLGFVETVLGSGPATLESELESLYARVGQPPVDVPLTIPGRARKSS